MSTHIPRLLAAVLIGVCDAASAAELRPFRLPSADQGRYVVPVSPRAVAPAVQDTAPARTGSQGKPAGSDAAPAAAPAWKKEVDRSTEEFDQLLKALDP